MAYDLYRGNSDDDTAKVAYLMEIFGEARVNRINFEAMWEEAASLVWPEFRNSFTFGHNRPPGMKYAQYQVDSAGSIAQHRFMSICDALITPYNLPWSVFKAGGPHAKELMRDREVANYFREFTEIVWTERYRASANFMSSQQQNYGCLGVFGGQGMFIEELDYEPGEGFAPGLRYIPQGPGEVYLLRNHQNRVTGCIRYFRWTARQAYGKWGDKVLPHLEAPLRQKSPALFDFLHFIIPRTDYDPNQYFSPKGKPYWSCYVSMTGQILLDEDGGYRKFPLAYGCYSQAPEEVYGRGPAQIALAELKTKNSEKSDYLKTGHRNADPTWLIGDDGLVDFKSHPGAFNYGGFTEDGKMLVGALPVGKFEVSEKMLEASQKIIDDAFLVSLFPLLFDNKGSPRDARAVIEMANDRGIFLAPTLGRQFGEYLGPLVEREVEILSKQRKFPKMPGLLKEAQGEYSYLWTSPLGRALSNQSIAGFMRTVEIAENISKADGDPSHMDIFDFEVALPEIADEQFVPTRWMSTAKKMAAKAKARQDAQERENQVKELPGKAAIMKAQAISDKAQTGGNIGGALSGTPAGGMPMLPGQTEPGGRAFG